MLPRVVVVISLGIVVALSATAAPPTDKDMLDAFPHPKGYVCYRAPNAITIDGDLTDAEWKAAPWTDAFVDIEGDTKPKPRFRTRVKMLWDDNALYIAAEMEEPHLWATLKDHDAVIFYDNDFEVFLDPDGDNHLYGELELNALNTTWDLLLTKAYKDGGHAVNAWEITGLQTAVKLDGTLNNPSDKDKGWTVEIKWPWKGLGELVPAKAVSFPPKDGEQWRINFSRVEWDVVVAEGKYRKVEKRAEHNWVWSPQGVIDMHRPERWGYLQFSTAKPGEATFQQDPDWNIRDVLHRAHYAQRIHHKDKGKYATKAEELGLKLPAGGSVVIDGTRDSYTMAWLGTKAATPRYKLTHDGRITK